MAISVLRALTEISESQREDSGIDQVERFIRRRRRGELSLVKKS